MSEAVTVAVVGATGFLGGEVVRLLARHPGFEVTALAAGRNAGRRLSDVRPSLRGPADGDLIAADPDVLAERAEVVVLALPHGKSGTLGAALHARGAKVIDLGSDFRLTAPADHQRYYARDPAAPELLDDAWYGLPELTGPPPPGTRLIANPGCFATALALTLAPLAGLADDVVVAGVTGSSGSGITPKASTQHSLRMTSFTAYKPLRHQHLGEVRQLLASRGPVPAIRFVPHSLPAARGIHLTTVLPPSVSAEAVREALHGAYADAALVDVVDGPVPLGAVVGSVRTLIGVEAHDEGVAVFTAIDNLLKGGSGQAVQNLNLWHGLDETLSLPIVGSWP